MNTPELIMLARKVNLNSDDNFDFRISFGVACMERVEHLLTDSLAVEDLSIGKAYVRGKCSKTSLKEAAASASKIARSHPGSNSIDGSGSAAVSTSHGVAAALAGRALLAADYAAYAGVYSYASHAVIDISAYSEEHGWQIRKFKSLVAENENKYLNKG